MKRGKKPGVEKEDVHIYLPQELLLEIQLRLLDPMRSRMRYGALSLLCERLLRDWLEAERAMPALDSDVPSDDNGRNISTG